MILRINCYLMMLLYLGIIKRTRGHLKEGLEEEKTRLVGQFKMEAQHITSSRQIRTPGPVRTKTNAQIASGVRLGFFLMVRKLTRLPSICHRSHVQIPSESTGIVETRQSPETSGCCVTIFRPIGFVSSLSPLRTRLGGFSRPQDYIFSSRHPR